MVRCPVCGTRLAFAEPTLNEQQQALRDVLDTLHRDLGRWPYAREVAVLLECSDREARRQLVELEEMKVVKRFGSRSGWALVAEHITVIHAA